MGNPQGKIRNRKISEASNHAGDNQTNFDETIERPVVVVWCDASIGSNSNPDDDTNTLMQLTRIVNKKKQLIHIFTEISGCQEFINKLDNICLIVSGMMGQTLIPLVHDLPQVHSIYIFCLNKPKYDKWAKGYPKVGGVYTDIKEICNRIGRFFISQVSPEHEQLQFSLLKEALHYPSEDRQETAFIYSILSKMILLEMTSRKEEMLDACRMEYTHEDQQQAIDDYAARSSQHDPIWWFTKDTFFQGILNRALQRNDLYTLCIVNPFLQAIEKKLVELNHQQTASTGSLLELYSTYVISRENFERIGSHQGSLMCINQFIFANADPMVPLMFSDSTLVNATTVNVLLKIAIARKDQPNVCYANIGGVSELVHEKEYLISMSSIYRIDEIESVAMRPSTQCIHLTLIDKNDAQLLELTQYMNRETFYQDSDLGEIGSTIMTKLHLFKCIRKLLNLRTEPLRSILLHYNMAVLHDSLNEYDKALFEYGQAIKLTRNVSPNGHHQDSLCLVPFYSNMGLTYQQLNRDNDAIVHAFRALEILSHNKEEISVRSELVASCHFYFGNILEMQDQFSEATTSYKQALKKRLEYLPEDHPDVVRIQEVIASIDSPTVDF